MYNERRISKMTVENYDHTITQELPYNDSSLDDWLQMFKTAMVGITYSESAVVEGIADYLTELGWDCISPEEKKLAEAEENNEETVGILRDRGYFVEPQRAVSDKAMLIKKFHEFFGISYEDLLTAMGAPEVNGKPSDTKACAGVVGDGGDGVLYHLPGQPSPLK